MMILLTKHFAIRLLIPSDVAEKVLKIATLRYEIFENFETMWEVRQSGALFFEVTS